MRALDQFSPDAANDSEPSDSEPSDSEPSDSAQALVDRDSRTELQSRQGIQVRLRAVYRAVEGVEATFHRQLSVDARRTPEEHRAILETLPSLLMVRMPGVRDSNDDWARSVVNGWLPEHLQRLKSDSSSLQEDAEKVADDLLSELHEYLDRGIPSSIDRKKVSTCLLYTSPSPRDRG